MCCDNYLSLQLLALSLSGCPVRLWNGTCFLPLRWCSWPCWNVDWHCSMTTRLECLAQGWFRCRTSREASGWWWRGLPQAWSILMQQDMSWSEVVSVWSLPLILDELCHYFVVFFPQKWYFEAKQWRCWSSPVCPLAASLAAEIKNRVGPPAPSGPTGQVKIESTPVPKQGGSGCC